MNKHKNIKKLARQTEPQFIQAMMERPDGPPAEVATEMLLRAPLTGGLRRTFFRARANYYESTLKPVEKALKLEKRFKQSTWQQIQKWLRRANARRQEAQDNYEMVHRRMVKMQTDTSNPEHQARAVLAKVQLDRLEAMIKQIEIFRDVAEDEIVRRLSFCAKLKKVAPSVAKNLKKELCPASE